MVLGILLVASTMLSSCSSSRNYKRAYRRAWKKIVNSEAWRDALVTSYNDQASETDAFAPVLENRPNVTVGGYPVSGTDEEFMQKYRSLVFRAYFRTIAEAEKADKRISEAYSLLRQKRRLEENRDNPEFTEDLELAKRRYQAHRDMLEGLRSWKAFSKYGSDDLDFFLKENLPDAYAMYRQGESDESILRLLIYRLADLYHMEERRDTVPKQDH